MMVVEKSLIMGRPVGCWPGFAVGGPPGGAASSLRPVRVREGDLDSLRHQAAAAGGFLDGDLGVAHPLPALFPLAA